MPQQKMNLNKKCISAEELEEIISCHSLPDSINKPNLHKRNFGNNLSAYFTEYFKYIEDKVKEKNLEQYISTKKLKYKEFCPVEELGTEFWLKYKVIISSLTIDNGAEHTLIDLRPIYVDEYVDIPRNSEFKQKSNGVLFEFRDNKFIGSRSSSITIDLGDDTKFSFIGNRFQDPFIGSRFGVPDFKVQIKGIGGTLLEFQENIFEDNYVAIGVDNFKGYGLGNWRLKEAVTNPILAANKLEYVINQSLEKDGDNIPGKTKAEHAKHASGKHVLNKIKIAPEQIEKVASKGVIRISSNEFNFFEIYGDGSFHFIGKNLIKQLITNPILPTIHWGAHQQLDKEGKYFLPHKKIFAILKQRAIANNDTMQEMILQKEIAKCDHAIAKSEKISLSENISFRLKNLKAFKNQETWENLKVWLGAWQDLIIFEFSKWISNYGTSWIRPFLWLFFFNGLISWLVCTTTGLSAGPSVGAIFLELFSPVSYLPELLNTDATFTPNAWISFLFILQKTILAFTLYEMIKIFRRFGKR